MENTGTSKKRSELDGLFKEIGVYKRGKELKVLFDFVKRFPNIAPFNALLLHIQKPGSTYVATASEWKDQFNRTIKPEARPLVILWPFAPVRFLFELGDTEGDDPFPEPLLKPFKATGKIHDKEFQHLINNLPRDGISFHKADHGTDSAGFIRPAQRRSIQKSGKKNVKVLYQLVANRSHSNEEVFATISHELGHLYCGHLGSPNQAWWPDRRGERTLIREFEAESVAWLVCERMGIQTPSAQYLSGYLGEDAQVPSISLDNVLKAAGMVEAMVKSRLTLRKELVVQ